jgi:hypothetical protein
MFNTHEKGRKTTGEGNIIWKRTRCCMGAGTTCLYSPWMRLRKGGRGLQNWAAIIVEVAEGPWENCTHRHCQGALRGTLFSLEVNTFVTVNYNAPMNNCVQNQSKQGKQNERRQHTTATRSLSRG